MFHHSRYARTAAITGNHLTPAAACVAAVMMLLSGCNDEVFVEPLPEMGVVELSPDGDHVEVSTGVGGAWFLSYNTISSLNGSVYLLDESGNRLGFASLGGSPIPGGLEIVYVNATGSLRLMATQGGKMTIDLDHCYSITDISLLATLEYHYGAVDVPIRIPAIEPFVATDIRYTGDFNTLPDEELTEGRRITVENSSSDSLPLILRPLEGAMAGVLFVPSDNVGSQIPVDYNGSPVQIPSIGAEGAGLYGISAPYLPEKRIEVAAKGIPSKEVKVMVPPESKRRYTCFIERRIIHARYVVTFGSPSVSRTFATTGDVRVAWPVGYVIGYNDL